jgi:hypothetical protein
MIIRSQDRKSVIDFTNNFLRIEYSSDNKFPICDKHEQVLGYFNTESRAMEVIDQFCREYTKNKGEWIFDIPLR